VLAKPLGIFSCGLHVVFAFVCCCVVPKRGRDRWSRSGGHQRWTGWDGTTCALTLPGLHHDSYVIQENDCGTPEVTEERTVETCGFGTRCRVDEDAGVQAACERSLTEEAAESPYYDYSCGTFSEWMEFPTGLDADCRCRYNSDGINNGFPTSDGAHPINVTGVTAGIINCTPRAAWTTFEWPLAYGNGPTFHGFATETAFGGDQVGGALDPVTREQFSRIQWTSPTDVTTGTVLSYNVDTGERRVVSGVIAGATLDEADWVDVGGGHVYPPSLTTNATVAPQSLTGGSSLRMGADGML
jgi:hypothetical protein